jgi:hypothetical protein
VIHAFTRSLADAFERRTIPPRLETEGEFERTFAVPLAMQHRRPATDERHRLNAR